MCIFNLLFTLNNTYVLLLFISGIQDKSAEKYKLDGKKKNVEIAFQVEVEEENNMKMKEENKIVINETTKRRDGHEDQVN